MLKHLCTPIHYLSIYLVLPVALQNFFQFFEFLFEDAFQMVFLKNSPRQPKVQSARRKIFISNCNHLFEINKQGMPEHNKFDFQLPDINEENLDLLFYECLRFYSINKSGAGREFAYCNGLGKEYTNLIGQINVLWTLPHSALASARKTQF